MYLSCGRRSADGDVYLKVIEVHCGLGCLFVQELGMERQTFLSASLSDGSVLWAQVYDTFAEADAERFEFMAVLAKQRQRAGQSEEVVRRRRKYLNHRDRVGLHRARREDIYAERRDNR